MRNMANFINRIINHRITHQLSWYTIGQLVVQLFSFFGIIVTSRYLGPTNIGLYSFVQNYLAAFMVITVGMDFYFTWKVAKSENKLREVKEYFGHKLNVTLILSFLGMITAWAILPSDVSFMTTVMFAPLILTSCTAFHLYAIATNRARLIASLQIVAAISLFITKTVLVALRAPLITFIVVNAVDMIIVATLITVVYFSQRNIRQIVAETAYPSLYKTFRFMFEIRMSLIAIALWQLILRIDQLVLATFTNAYSLGIYAAAVKIAEVPNFLAGILYTSLVTHVALITKTDDQLSKRRIRQVLMLYAVIGIAIMACIIITAPIAIQILYGDKFREAIPVLRTYALSIPGMFVTLHYFGVYGARDRHLFQSVVFGLALVLNVALVYVFTPLFGLAGAGFATAIAYNMAAATFYFHVH